jgi:hypothetical protein
MSSGVSESSDLDLHEWVWMDLRIGRERRSGSLISRYVCSVLTGEFLLLEIKRR